MNVLRFGLVCVLALTFGATAVAQPDPAAEAERLVKQLGSARFADRELALKALDALGPAALPALRRAAQSEDPEVRRRVANLIVKQERLADSAAAFAPTKVHLKATNAPLSDIIRDLVQQSHIPLHLAREPVDLPDRLVTLDTGPIAAWEALDTLCRAARISIRPEEFDPIAAPVGRSQSTGRAGLVHWAEQPLVLQNGPLPVYPTAYLGAVRVRLLPLRWDNRGRGPNAEHRWLLEVLTEPRLRWQGPPAIQLSAPAGWTLNHGQTSDNPIPLANTGPPGIPRQAGPRLAARHEFLLFVKGNPLMEAEPVAFHGTLSGMTQLADMQTLTIADLQKAGGATTIAPDNTKLKVVEYTTDDKGVSRIKVEVERPEAIGGGTNSSHSWGGVGGAIASATSSLVNFGRDGESFRLFDAQDQPFSIKLLVNLARRQNGLTTVTYTLEIPSTSPAAQPCKLELDVPRRTSVETKFSLRNVLRQ